MGKGNNSLKEDMKEANLWWSKLLWPIVTEKWDMSHSPSLINWWHLWACVPLSTNPLEGDLSFTSTQWGSINFCSYSITYYYSLLYNTILSCADYKFFSFYELVGKRKVCPWLGFGWFWAKKSNPMKIEHTYFGWPLFILLRN